MTEMTGNLGASNMESAFSRWWKSRTYLQRRVIRFCLSMLTMVICFPLYYMGLFGGVEGPLNPARMGEQLARMGATRTHFMMIFLSLLIISITWNWIFNLVSSLAGNRLTCKRGAEDGNPCGAPVRRGKIVQKKTGQEVYQFVCTLGHKRPDAHFHPVRKGTFSQTIAVISLIFSVMVFFMS